MIDWIRVGKSAPLMKNHFWPCAYVRNVIIYYWAANNFDLISKKFHHFCVHWIPWYCILFLMTAAYWKSLWNIAVIDLNFRMSHGKTKTDWTSFTLLSWWYHCEKIAKIVVKVMFLRIDKKSSKSKLLRKPCSDNWLYLQDIGISKWLKVMGSMFHVCLIEAKNWLFEFDYEKMNMFDSIQCSKNVFKGPY